MSYVTYKGQKFYINNGSLDLSKSGIDDILEVKGLEKCINLEGLYLHSNKISKIEGLESLTKLKDLALSDNNISVIEGLETLTELKELYLNHNKIAKIEGLDTLANLKNLYLHANQISRIEGLKTLINLQHLSLYDNKITKIEGLGALANLRELYLPENEITIIKGLKELTRLKKLFLSINRITEIKGLESLTNLEQLHLEGNPISIIKGLESLTNLKQLYLSWDKIKREQRYLQYCELQEIIDYCRKGSEVMLMRMEKIIDSKTMFYKNGIKRCTLFNKPFQKCGKEDKIEKMLKTPKIMGFFMYQFPKRFKISLRKKRKFYVEYHKEINELKRIIQNLNQSNDFFQINFPDEATDTLTKTCSFCEIARSYDFGLLLLTPPNYNAFFEAGMFMSLGKRVLLLNNDSYSRKIPFDLEPYFYIHYDNVEKIEKSWNKKIPEFLEQLLNYYLEF